MSAEHFLATNVLVCLFDKTDNARQRRAETLENDSLADGTGCIGFQVVKETLNVLIRRLGFMAEDSRRALEDFLAPFMASKPHSSALSDRHLPPEPLRVLLLRLPYCGRPAGGWLHPALQ